MQRTAWLSSLGAGAAAPFLFDPASGRRRRHRIADSATRTARVTGGAASTVARDLRNRAAGIGAALRHRFRAGDPDKAVLEERVHSALGRVVAHAHAITVDVQHGRVVLDGPIPPADRPRIISAVRAVPGVRRVGTRFTRHILPAYDSSSGGALPGKRNPPRPDVLQRHWAPATRALVAASGAVLAAAGATRRDRIGLGLAAAGAALIVRAAANAPLCPLGGINSRTRAAA